MVPMNKNGFSLIELVVVALLISILSLGLVSFAQYLNTLTYASDLQSVNQNFNELNDILKSSNCFSFRGKTFNKGKIEITEIGENSIIPNLYRSKKNNNFSISSDLLSEDAYIKKMFLYRPDINNTSKFEVFYQIAGDREIKKILKIKVFLDDDNIIEGCSNLSSLNKCKITQPIIPAKTTKEQMGQTCLDILDSQSKSLKNKNAFAFFKEEEVVYSGITKKAHIVSAKKEGQSESCICLGLFTCYKGYLAQVIKCFTANTGIVEEEE